MGKHSHKGTFGGDKSRSSRPDARRVPMERRRTPGESATADAVHGDAESYQLSDPNSRRRGSLESAPARLRIERDRRRSRTKQIVLGVVLGLAVLIVLGMVGAFAYAKYIERTMHPSAVEQVKIGNTLTKAKPMEPFNLLILGADYRKGDTAYRTDSIMVVHVDPAASKIWLMSIPRDTRAEIPGHGARKITEAHAFGGTEASIAAVEKLTGLKMNHYLEMNFAGFRDAVDALGGVWVDVPVTINDTEADQTPGNTASHIDAGYQLLDGVHALTFVRARHQFQDEDFTRMKNQQLFFRALADQVAKIDNIAKLPGVVSAVAPYVQTDMSLIQMMDLAKALKGAGSKNMYTATAKGTWRSPFVYMDEANLRKLLEDIKNEVPFDKTSAEASGSTSATATAKTPSQIKITIRNGAGVSGVAKQAASILQAKGFKIGDVGNANQNVYKKTLVIYKTDVAAAQLVASFLPPGTGIVQSRGMYSYPTEVLVMIGKDWDLNKVPVVPVVTQ